MNGNVDTNRIQLAIIFLRVVVAAMMFAHGFARTYYGGVSGFGSFFASKGVPYGLVLAWGITIFEMVASVLIALGIFVTPLAALFMIELIAGIALVHFKEGWFVVGLGRNGMEFSVLLVTAFAVLGFSHYTGRTTRR